MLVIFYCNLIVFWPKMLNIHSHGSFFFFILIRYKYTIYNGSGAQISFIDWTSLEQEKLRKVIRASSEL